MDVNGDPVTCGIYHIGGFYNPTASTSHTPYILKKNPTKMHLTDTITYEERFRECLKQIDDATAGSKYGNKIASCCLTDSQISDYPEWPGILADTGFRLVSRFRNTTAQWNNVFHFVPNEDHVDYETPSWWKGK